MGGGGAGRTNTLTRNTLTAHTNQPTNNTHTHGLTNKLTPTHPQVDSRFAEAYNGGVHKSKYWEPVFEDSMSLIAKLPAVAAAIYRNTSKGGDLIEAHPQLDWGANLAHMMGEHCVGGGEAGRGV